MRFPIRLLPLVPVVAATVATLVIPSAAGPDKIKFPASWKEHVLYTVVDRHDTKQYRELYASTPAAVDAMKAGKALPDGTVLTLVQYKAQVDAAASANGEFFRVEVGVFELVRCKRVVVNFGIVSHVFFKGFDVASGTVAGEFELAAVRVKRAATTLVRRRDNFATDTI